MYVLWEGLNSFIMFSLKYPNIIKNVSLCLSKLSSLLDKNKDRRSHKICLNSSFKIIFP